MSDLGICQRDLIELAESKGYLTFDDIMDTTDMYDLTLSEVDEVTEQIQMRDIIVYENEPVESVSEDRIDYSHLDYNLIYDELLSMSDELEYIIYQVKNLPTPQHGEINMLFTQMKSGNEYARESLIFMHIRIALKIALATSKQYDFDIVEAVSSGITGLILSVDKFDNNGFSAFQSYASTWIYQNIMRDCCPTWFKHPLPAHLRDKIYKIIQIFKEHEIEIDDNMFIYELPSNLAEQLSEIFDVQIETASSYLKEMYKQYKGELALNQTIFDNESDFNYLINYYSVSDCLTVFDESSQLYEVIPSYSNVDQPEEAFNYSFFINELESKLLQLTDREERVIRLKYGLKDLGKYYTLSEIAEIFNCTRERIRQIQNKALSRLRKNLDKDIYYYFFNGN